MKEYLLPTRIVDYQGVNNVDALFIDKGFYAHHNGASEEWDKLYTKMIGKGSYIVLDFGQEMSGGVIFFTGWIYEASCKIRIRFGESLGEVNSNLGEKGACNAHSPRDFETIICSSGDNLVGQTGFRFVRIDVLEDKYIYFRNVVCENNIYSAKQIYDYQGNDKRIKDIFNTAKRTIDLCAGTGYIWDGVKRDRLVWLGDMAPEVMALSTLYGQCDDVVISSLEQAKKSFPLPRYLNDIYTYSMWLLIIAHDYYKDFNNVEYVKANLEYYSKLVHQMLELIDKNGNINKKHRYIVDWPTVGTVDEETGVKMIFLMAMNKAIDLFSEFKVDASDALEIKRRILLNPIVVKEKKQVVALKYFATGELKDEEYQLLIKDGANGFSTFMSYYILSTIAARDEQLAINLMKDYYGAMLDKGATTFFEDFDIAWCKDSGRIDELDITKKDIHGDFGKYCYVGYRHSLCHGWSSGVIKFIKEHC